MFLKSPLLLFLCAVLLLAFPSYSMQDEHEETKIDLEAFLSADTENVQAPGEEQQIVQAEAEVVEAAVAPLLEQEDVPPQDLLVNAEG